MCPDILLFDGDCNLCNNAVQFILKRNTDICFASLQSTTGIELLIKYELAAESLNTLVFIQNNSAYLKSAAVLKIIKKLNGLWPLLYVFAVVPSFISNKLYDLIANYRFQWFGRRKNCMLPEGFPKSRFIE